jgi:hypothetical protein
MNSGHIYIVDLESVEDTYSWILTAILLHQKPFIDESLKFPQITSAARFKINSIALYQQTLSIQQALKDGKRVYAQVLFDKLKLMHTQVPNDIPNTEAELLEFNHVVVEYRGGANY